MIVDVLNFLKIPNEQGFFDKDLKPEEYLTEGWQERVYRRVFTASTAARFCCSTSITWIGN